MGSAPSHTAQALTPPPVWASRSSDSSPIQLAVAPGRDHDGVGAHGLAARGVELVRSPVRGEVDTGDILADDRRPEAFGLRLELLHHFRALDAVGEAGVVLDIRREHELPPGEDGPGVLLGDADVGHGVQVGAGGVDRGGPARGARADDDEVVGVLKNRSNWGPPSCGCGPTPAGMRIFRGPGPVTDASRAAHETRDTRAGGATRVFDGNRGVRDQPAACVSRRGASAGDSPLGDAAGSSRFSNASSRLK